MNAAARLGGRTYECLVGTSATACPTAPTTALAGRKFVELQNLGPNPIFCAVGGSTAVVNDARRLAPLPASGPADSWMLQAGPAVAVTCIAATAAQATGAATIVTELKRGRCDEEANDTMRGRGSDGRGARRAARWSTSNGSRGPSSGSRAASAGSRAGGKRIGFRARLDDLDTDVVGELVEMDDEVDDEVE